MHAGPHTYGPSRLHWSAQYFAIPDLHPSRHSAPLAPPPHLLQVRADVELTCFQYDGIERIKVGGMGLSLGGNGELQGQRCWSKTWGQGMGCAMCWSEHCRG